MIRKWNETEPSISEVSVSQYERGITKIHLWKHEEPRILPPIFLVGTCRGSPRMRPAESMCINQRHRRSCARVASMRNWCDGRVRGCDWQDLFFKMMAIDHRFIGLILRAKPVQVSGGYSQLLISFLLLEWMDPIRILLMVEKCCDTLFALKINGCNLKITQLIQGRSSEANTSIIVFQPFIFKGVLFTSGFVRPKWSFEKPWKLVTHHKDRDGTKGKAKVRPVFFSDNSSGCFLWTWNVLSPCLMPCSFTPEGSDGQYFC